MHYHIYCNKKNITTNHSNALKEFEKRLSTYCTVSLHTTDTLAFPKDMHLANHDFIFVKRGQSSYSSTEFSAFINQLQHSGKSTIHIMIGYDIADFYTAIANYNTALTPHVLSLSQSTLSNDTLTVLFYEQLYRGYTILQGKTYHK